MRTGRRQRVALRAKVVTPADTLVHGARRVHACSGGCDNAIAKGSLYIEHVDDNEDSKRFHVECARKEGLLK